MVNKIIIIISRVFKFQKVFPVAKLIHLRLKLSLEIYIINK